MSGRRLRLGAAAVLLALCVAVIIAGGREPVAAASAARPEPASSAQRFLDSIGVVTHIVYYDTAYGEWGRAVAALDRLGVKHVREGLYASPAPELRDFTQRDHQAIELAAGKGIRFDFLVSDPARGGTLGQQVAALTGPLRGTADSVEGPNEPDNVDGPGWAPLTRAVQAELYRTVKADPVLRRLPVIGPSFVRDDSRAVIGDLSAVSDAGNIHPYTGGLPPSPEQLRSQAALARVVSGRKPLYATEAGFHNALSATTGFPPTSERAAAVYTLRTFLEHYAAGVVRTYAYELLDEKPDPSGSAPEQHFGLLRNDFSVKPAFEALANLIAALRPERGWKGAPGALGVTVGGDPGRVRQLLLRRGRRQYSLILWQSASVWDRDARKDLAVPAVDVRVSAPGMSDATIVRPVRGRAAQPSDAVDGTTSVAVAADPVILTWTGGAPAQAAGASGGRGVATFALVALVAASGIGVLLIVRRRRRV